LEKLRCRERRERKGRRPKKRGLRVGERNGKYIYIYNKEKREKNNI
jgi:hypothetical protein